MRLLADENVPFKAILAFDDLDCRQDGFPVYGMLLPELLASKI
jgi:hypothetical protein